MTRRPLDDVAIVETYTHGTPPALRLAGALAGRIAADLGARVTVTAPTMPDLERTLAVLDLGKRTAHRADDADALITDDATHAALTSPPPVAAVLSLFRPGAEAAPPAASEFTISALGGLLDIVGDPEREPLKLGGHQAAYAAGLAAFTGLAAALCRQPVDGGPPRETVRIALLDTVIWLNWKSVPTAPGEPFPTRAGADAEWQVVRCADGWIALVYQETDWPALCALLDDPRLAEPRFALRGERLRNARALAALVEERFASLTRRDIHRMALAKRLPLGPVWSPQELCDDPQTLARDFLMPTDLDAYGPALLPRLPVLWNGQAFLPGRGAPR